MNEGILKDLFKLLPFLIGGFYFLSTYTDIFFLNILSTDNIFLVI